MSEMGFSYQDSGALNEPREQAGDGPYLVPPGAPAPPERPEGECILPPVPEYNPWGDIVYWGKTLWEAVKELASPLTADLDGDGIELVSLASSTTRWDLTADGFAEHSGWTTGDDGFRWWHLEDDSWVRGDIVKIAGDCSQFLQNPPEATAEPTAEATVEATAESAGQNG